MTRKRKPHSGEGGAHGAPVEPTTSEPARDGGGDIEIPIGMPVSPAEAERLKRAAERHRREEHDDDPPAQQDDT